MIRDEKSAVVATFHFICSRGGGTYLGFSSSAFHRVGLPGASLPISKDGAIVALKNLVHYRSNRLIKQILLLGSWAKNLHNYQTDNKSNT